MNNNSNYCSLSIFLYFCNQLNGNINLIPIDTFMRTICRIAVLLFAIINFSACNKDDYGKTRDELLEEIEYAETEQLSGFSDWGKTWIMQSVEYEGVEYPAHSSQYQEFDTTSIIP